MTQQQSFPHDGPPLELDSDFGVLEGDALGLVERRYAHRGLAVVREDFTSRKDDGDVICTAREGTRIVGTLTVRFDGQRGLKADPLFSTELAEWRAAGTKLCEFGSLAVDKHSQNPKRLLAQLFHLGYLHAYRRAGFERLVVEVNPRHVAFYRRWLGLLPYTTARHNTRVEAPAVLMSLDFATMQEQIGLWGGRPEQLTQARCLYPLAWDATTEAQILESLG